MSKSRHAEWGLTVAEAKECVKTYRGKTLDLSELNRLSSHKDDEEVVAEVLSKHDGGLMLNGLPQISSDVA